VDFPEIQAEKGTPPEREFTKDILPGGCPLGVSRRNASPLFGTEPDSGSCDQNTCIGLSGGETDEFRDTPPSLRWVPLVSDADLGGAA
jgi:hypothetical protein